MNAPEIGVFKAYILVSDPKKNLIGSRSLPELIPFITPYDIPPFGPIAQKGFHMLNKRPTPHGDTAGPFLLTDFLKTALLPPRKTIYRPDSVSTNCIFQCHIRYFPWPDPFDM
jgi:hypothetical protein